MRPTSTSTMLQQNNNNNYPCLNVPGSTREMLQKSLPFPSRLELGLGDLPLIRGLRAWALCSKNRRKPGSFLGGGQAPTAPPLNRGGSAPCTRPADVYLSGEWGRSMGYGLPLGLDAGHGQAGIGALVTVATLKTSEGSGKTQTQCLFLRTEKGSCLYSTAKPGSGSTNSSVVGGWLRGKTGGGRGSDTPGGRRDNGQMGNPPPPQTGANRVRVRSGRRWRKSCNSTAGREKAGVSRERRQSSGREDPAGETPLEERQEEPDKGRRGGGGLESERFPSPGQQDNRKAKQEKGEGACRSPKCCHNASPKTCMRCGEKAQMGASQEDESLRRGVSKWPDSEVKGMRKERQKNEEEEKALESSNSVLALPNPDLESKHFHTESHGEEIRGDESNKQPTKQPSHSKDDRSEKGDDTNSVVMETRTGGKDLSGQVTDDFTSQLNSDIDYRKPCGETAANGNGFSDHVGADQGAEKETEREDGSINQTPAEFYYEGFHVSTCPAASSESSAAVGGSTCNDEHYTCKDDHLDLNHQQWVAESGINGKEEVEDGRFENPNCVADENKTFFFKNVEEREALSSPLQHSDTPFFETDGRIITENCCYFSKTEFREESVCENREEEAQNIERVNSVEAGNIQRRKFTSKELDGSGKGRHTEGILNDRTTQEYVERDCAVNYKCRLQEKDAGDTCEQTSFTHVEANVETNANVINVPYAEPPTTSAPPSLANPAPSLPPLGSMATGQPCLEAEKENENVKEVEGFGRDANGGRIGKRELEEQRGSTVATEHQEDEFGVFMQAEGERSTMSASVPCGSRESAAAALENHTISGESTHWTPGWTDSSFHQSDDSWTAFPQDSTDEAPDAPGQWWPTSAVDESRDRLASVFAEAFPSLPGSPSTDLDTVPTLTQLLRGRASQDQGLLDSFHDLNKMICQRYKRANGVSRDLLLKTLHLEQPHTECRPAPRTSNRRLSPGLPSANQHAQNAGAKRRLSYDYNRNIME